MKHTKIILIVARLILFVLGLLFLAMIANAQNTKSVIGGGTSGKHYTLSPDRQHWMTTKNGKRVYIPLDSAEKIKYSAQIKWIPNTPRYTETSFSSMIHHYCIEFCPTVQDSVKMTFKEYVKYTLPNECSFWGHFQRWSISFKPYTIDVRIKWKQESYDCTAEEFVEMIYR